MISQSVKELLAEIGLLAAGNGLHKQAEIIFTGLEKNNANSQLIALGRATSLLSNDHFSEAIRIMQDGREPGEAALLDALIGYAYIRQGYAKRAEEHLALADQSSDPGIREISAGFRQLLLL